MITGDILGERARLTPHKLALVDVARGQRLSYVEMDRRAARAARVLLTRLGLGPGDRFGILSQNRIEYLDLFFASGKSGAVVVPLGTRLTAQELATIVADAGLSAVFFDPTLAGTAAELREITETSIAHWISFEEKLPPADLSYPALAHAIDDAPLAVPPIDPEHPFSLLYTSGTTGTPKGVVLPHRMIAWNAIDTAVSWQLREDDISPVFTPLYHAGGLAVFLTPLFAIGGTIVLHRGFDPGEIWRTMAAERCTVALGVPTIWQRLAEAPEFETTDLSSVRWLISGGAPLPEGLIHRYQRRGVVLKQGYGLTEVGVNCFAMTADDAFERPGSIGKPMLFTAARLVDADGHDATEGELWLRGPHVCRGYWNNPEATAASLDADGWFHTGDIGRRDAEGYYYIVGRLKDMYISGGVNVYPAEVEAALLRHPRVAEVAVVGVPDETWGEAGVAFVVLDPPGENPADDADELRAHLGSLARFKIPKEFVVVETLPRSAYGKVIKPDLRARFVQGDVR